MQRAFGIDISKWDVSFIPTGKAEFVIMRSSYGTPSGKTYVDEKFNEFYPNSLSVPVRGAYHYMSSHGSWKEQADRFIELVSGKDIHFYACDVEPAFNTMSQKYISMSMEWMNYVKEKTNKKVILYTNFSIYNSWINVYEKERASKYPLWIAQYNYAYQNYMSTYPALPRDRKDWSIWQFIPGEWGKFGREVGVGRAGVDGNVFNGTIDEMKAWANVSPSSEVTPPKPVYQKMHKVTVDQLRIRLNPSEKARTVGSLVRNQMFEIEKVETDFNGNVWAKIGQGRHIAVKYYGNYYTSWRD